MSGAGVLIARTEYEINDIGTLQTHESTAIALNNQGQILGRYNLGESEGSDHFFLRDKDGCFSEIPSAEEGMRIHWMYLTDGGEVYGLPEDNSIAPILFVWTLRKGVVNLGEIPGRNISAINNSGQVLISHVHVNDSTARAVIWDQGTTTALKGLDGDLGIDSEQSFGFDMNNNGEVVGQSIANLVYKDELYQRKHAAMWANGLAIDLHKRIPKDDISSAEAINDLGDVLIYGSNRMPTYVVRKNGQCIRFVVQPTKINTRYAYSASSIIDLDGKIVANLAQLNAQIMQDSSDWLTATSIIEVNDSGAFVVQGKSIYGEEHAMLVTLVNSQ